jgi:hypothetical protein
VHGAAWDDGTGLKSIEVKIDDGPWTAAQFRADRSAPYAWTFWTYDWNGAGAGEHTVTSRAIDVRGRVQPDPSDPSITLKKTYWESNQQGTRKIRI